MAYGEVQVMSWDVQYKAELIHSGGGRLTLNAVVYSNPEREGQNDVAFQAAIDQLLSDGFTLDGAWKYSQSGQQVTATEAPAEPE